MTLFLVFFVGVTILSSTEGSQGEQNLVTKLLKDYDRRVRPTNEPSDLVVVTGDVFLVKFINVDEAKRSVDIGIFFAASWNDSRLAYKPGDFKNTKKIILPSTQIWIPDLFIVSGFGAIEFDLGSHENIGASVKPSGEVVFVRQMAKTLSCINKSDKYGLTCTFDIGSLTMDASLLKLKISSKTIDTSLLQGFVDSKYTIKNTTYEIAPGYPEDENEKWEVIRGRIVIQAGGSGK